MKAPVNHIWFDFSETIARINKPAHDKLKYSTYASVVDKPLDEELKREFDEQYQLHNNSVSNIFHSLGKPSGWWSGKIAELDPSELFSLMEQDIPSVLEELKEHIPISIFSNIDLINTLPALGIDISWFIHILSSGMVAKPKPALDGFYKIIELSELPSREILYIGDHEGKDILPAKEAGLQAGMMYGKSDKADYNFESFSDAMALVQ